MNIKVVWTSDAPEEHSIEGWKDAVGSDLARPLVLFNIFNKPREDLLDRYTRDRTMNWLTEDNTTIEGQLELG